MEQLVNWKENHIATPVNDFVTNLVHAKENQRGAQ